MGRNWPGARYFGTCATHSKHQYVTRKEAKQAARAIAPGDKAVNEYRCPDGGWHWGHLPARILRGKVGRDIYRTGA